MRAWLCLSFASLGVSTIESPGETESCCWCDPATPGSAERSQTHRLVFSDEFNRGGRNFSNGKDQKWTGLEVADTANEGNTVYLPGQATVAFDPEHDVSALRIATERVLSTGTTESGSDVTMPFRSAMLQSWNKFCFTGGVVEFRARMPHGTGYWPALWLFGNLGRAVYQDSNTGLWPWSYDECDDDLDLAPTSPPQRISACDDRASNEGLLPFQGRGATEIDIVEAAVRRPSNASYIVSSLQISPAAPFFFKPKMGSEPTDRGEGSWYDNIAYGSNSHVQAGKGWYGPPWGADCPFGCPDTLSASVVNDVFDESYRTYRLDWALDDGDSAGALSWFLDDTLIWSLDGRALGEYSMTTTSSHPVSGSQKTTWRTPRRAFPREPMSLVINTAIGTWNGGFDAIEATSNGTEFYIDYVRVWQSEVNVGCDPPNYPMQQYITANAGLYGPPVRPLGNDTCPERYPPSAFDHAAAILARAGDRRRVAAAVAAARAARDEPVFNWTLWREAVGRKKAQAQRELEAHLSSLDDTSTGLPPCTRLAQDSYATGSRLPCCRGLEEQAVAREADDPLRDEYPEITLCLPPPRCAPLQAEILPKRLHLGTRARAVPWALFGAAVLGMVLARWRTRGTRLLGSDERESRHFLEGRKRVVTSRQGASHTQVQV